MCKAYCSLQNWQLSHIQYFVIIRLSRLTRQQCCCVFKPAQCSPFQTSRICHLWHHLLPTKMAWNFWKFHWQKKKDSSKFILPNSELCIDKKVRAKLSAQSGLKWGKFLFRIMHWSNITSSDACQCSSSLKKTPSPVQLNSY